MTRQEQRVCQQVGKRIAGERLRQKMSRRALARDVGVDHARLRQVELGTGNPSLCLLVRVARALEVELTVFFKAGSSWVQPLPAAGLALELLRQHNEIGQMRGVLEAANEGGIPQAS